VLRAPAARAALPPRVPASVLAQADWLARLPPGLVSGPERPVVAVLRRAEVPRPGLQMLSGLSAEMYGCSEV
jgi:hypothetical protein